MIIRQEMSSDKEKVYHLVREAFATAQHSDGTEQDLVERLRTSEAFIPELSLVAEEDGIIIGHILFTKALVGKETVLALAPLAVDTAYQNQGVGSALITEGHSIARELGYSYSIVLGSEKYYPKHGYMLSTECGIHVPEGIPKENYMAIKLCQDAPDIEGEVIYAKEFGM